MVKPDHYTKEPKKEKGGRLRRLGRALFLLVFTVVVALCATAAGLYLYFSRDLPRITTLKDYQPPTVSTVYAADGTKIGEFCRERRYVIGLDKMPKALLDAFVAAEDSRFYEHEGVDIMGILRAAVKNIQAGGIVQGGSTITQQVTKTFFLSSERSYTRKIREAILARRLDKSFTKQEILYLYLNQIYLGHGAYGVEAAARSYFGKPAEELSLAECAMLAGLPQAPSRYSPFRRRKLAKQRQIYVLNRMVEEGMITDSEAGRAINQPLSILPNRNLYVEKVPWYTEHVRRYVEEKYGRKLLYEGGLCIHTAVDVRMQEAARDAVRKGLVELDRRTGYRGPIKRLSSEEIAAFLAQAARAPEVEPPPAGETKEEALIDEPPGAAGEEKPEPPKAGDVVEGLVVEVDESAGRVHVRLASGEAGYIKKADVLWARPPNPEKTCYDDELQNLSRSFSRGDLIRVKLVEEDARADAWRLALVQEPDAQAALICMEAGTGLVRVLVGGYDFTESQFNRAVQAVRQPGSAFKPIIYAAALDKGYTAASVLIDSPIVFRDENMDFTWKPENYKRTFHGPTLFRDALAHSRNVVTIKLLQDIGVDYVIDYARRMGITQPLARDLSIALGSSGIPLEEMVGAYSVFANQGLYIKPCYVTSITDRNGNVLEEHVPEPQKAIGEDTAYIMTHLLQGVVDHGTGWRIKELERPVAGKTGTTNDLKDAWFIGFTPRYATGVWVGYDSDKSLGKGETGSRAASPIWLDYMARILQGKPVKTFAVPRGVVFAKIDAETGLLAIPESKKTVFECFKEGTAPDRHAPRPGSQPVEVLTKGL
ncbi:MAG: PBP1A family penicillin-binding protein [Deltaproteobacteria bacterium]|nr:PBP1A family penicillin-binding protein [Deltaproteobacteria bacterium]